MDRGRLFLVGVVAVALALTGAIASAAVINGTNRDDVLRGTNKGDRLDGRRGDDVLKALNGSGPARWGQGRRPAQRR
jgi:hypothetical protein